MAEAQLNSMLNVLRRKRKAYVDLAKRPESKTISLRNPKPGERKRKKKSRLPFELPRFEPDPELGIRQNSNWSVDATVALYNAALRCWTMGELSRPVGLPSYVQRMNLHDFEQYTGVKVNLTLLSEEDQLQGHHINGMPLLAFQLECSLVDSKLPLGKEVAEVISAGFAQREELFRRSHELNAAVMRINRAILKELPILVDGGMSAFEPPVYTLDNPKAKIEKLPGFNALIHRDKISTS